MNGVFVDSNVILRHLGGDVRAKRIVDLVLFDALVFGGLCEGCCW